MKYLLDTHIALWALLDPDRLTEHQRKLIQDERGQKLVSSISIWEISIKYGLGKLDLDGYTPLQFLSGAERFGMKIVVPEARVLASVHELPAVTSHKDPFDRLLIWQAINELLFFVSSDRAFEKYAPHGLKVV